MMPLDTSVIDLLRHGLAASVIVAAIFTALVIKAGHPDKVQSLMQELEDWHNSGTEHFRKEMVRGRVVEMRNTSHYCFIQREEEVVREMRAFLLGEPRVPPVK